MASGPDIELIERFVARGNFHAAMNTAISALNACHRNSDQDCVDRCLVIIKGIVETMAKEFGSTQAKR